MCVISQISSLITWTRLSEPVPGSLLVRYQTRDHVGCGTTTAVRSNKNTCVGDTELNKTTSKYYEVEIATAILMNLLSHCLLSNTNWCAYVVLMDVIE